MKYGFIRKFCRLLYHTLSQELRLHSLVFVVPFWNAFFGTQRRKNIESWNNQYILGYIRIASIVRVIREWSPFNRLQIFTIAPIVRIELEVIQAIVIAPIVRAVSVARGGGYSQKNWVGVCGPLPKTLTLFMTKICDFPYPIYDLTKNLIPYL